MGREIFPCASSGKLQEISSPLPPCALLAHMLVCQHDSYVKNFHQSKTSLQSFLLEYDYGFANFIVDVSKKS